MHHTIRITDVVAGGFVHGTRILGKVADIDTERGLGIIETAEGISIHFSVHDVTRGNFFEFEPGDEVRVEFIEPGALKSRHATSVWPVAKHHLTD